MAIWLDGHLPDTCRILVSAGRPRAIKPRSRSSANFRTVPELAPGATVDAVLAMVPAGPTHESPP
jgi:hypothetical protein